MHMVYNSENFVVVRFQVEQPPAADVQPKPEASLNREGFEIVDKTARREIYIEGALAERFQRGVQHLVDNGADTEEAFDAYIADFAGLAQQALVLH